MKKEHLTPPKLRYYRCYFQESQQEIADLVGVNRATYCLWECGYYQFSAAAAAILCEHWHVDIQELLSPLPKDFTQRHVKGSAKQEQYNRKRLFML